MTPPSLHYKEVSACRICGNRELAPVLSLGRQSLTGIFPKAKNDRISEGPVDLVRCVASGEDHCGLVQLLQTYRLDEMYGEHYGYRSGLNASMVRHLQGIVDRAASMAKPKAGDLVVDIGSNDATLLKAYSTPGLQRLGVDPTGAKFKAYYPPDVDLVADFFPSAAALARIGGRPARIITSISMFYDLESPLDFMKAVAAALAGDGIWVVEQSYLPEMLAANAYDTICHEHLEFYALRQLKWMADRAGLKIVDVEINDVNGGSFALTLAKTGAPYPEAKAAVAKLLASEKPLATAKPFADFERRVLSHRDALRAFVDKENKAGRKVLGYGASTKGNVMLQFCGFTSKDIPFIGEVNEDKFGRFTPGSLIPIIPEGEAKAMKPGHLIVFPWHFKDFILKKEAGYLRSGGRLYFPLPKPEAHGGR